MLDGALREAASRCGDRRDRGHAGPGLHPALLVGLSFAKGLAMGNRIPVCRSQSFHRAYLRRVSLTRRIARSRTGQAIRCSRSSFRAEHTSLVLIGRDGKATALGGTIDDAAGEALDKGAKLLNLGYPGGPVMQRTAEGGDPHRFEFPRPLTGAAGKPLAPENRYNFSFSGIKTALLYHVKHHADESGRLPEALLRVPSPPIRRPSSTC